MLLILSGFSKKIDVAIRFNILYLIKMKVTNEIKFVCGGLKLAPFHNLKTLFLPPPELSSY